MAQKDHEDTPPGPGSCAALPRAHRQALVVTGEAAEFESARLLGLELAAARQAGYDAIRTGKGRRKERLSIKGRCILPGASKSQKFGKIDITKAFDGVLMVMLDELLAATAIYEAPRDAAVAPITKPGSKARDERWALPVSKFRKIGQMHLDA